MSKYLKFETPAQKQAADLKSEYGLKNHGLVHLDRVYWNLPEAALYEEAVFRNEGKIVFGGPFVVNTGKWTARAASEKYFVKESTTEGQIDWGKHNRPVSTEKFDNILSRLQAFLQDEELFFVQDVYVGADPDYQMPIRIITDLAWHSLFARNMFMTIPTLEKYKTHIPEFTVIPASSFKLDPRVDGTNTETGIIIDFSEHLAIVANTSYAGEIKKSIFTVMNFLMPFQNVMPMHALLHVGSKGDVAIFFGLSGTGKTTLSADPNRRLISDDEHGWSEQSVFNFENGCYAKVIRLSAENEPEIYECTRKFGTILENVVFEPYFRKIDLDDDQLTEILRASYPLEFIPNAVQEKMVKSHPKNIIFLTCDAQGVMPPIAQLDMNQAIYKFYHGYT